MNQNQYLASWNPYKVGKRFFFWFLLTCKYFHTSLMLLLYAITSLQEKKVPQVPNMDGIFIS